MALSQSAVSDLLEVLRSREAVDVIRESVRMVMQELIEAEATQVIGAARYERTDTRVTERNGYRPRTVSTKAGDIELRIPKLRKGARPFGPWTSSLRIGSTRSTASRRPASSRFRYAVTEAAVSDWAAGSGRCR
jgi:hypothetical protein